MSGEAIPRLPARLVDSNKGSHGKGLLIAGGPGMTGAAILAGTAMLRSGAGLVTVAMPRPSQTIIALGNPCYMTVPLPEDAETGMLSQAALGPALSLALARDVVAVGPGCGTSAILARLVLLLLERFAGPMVLDADALNSLGAVPSLPPRSLPPVLTPHPGECARLSGLTIAQVQADRQSHARTLAHKLGAVVLLKGHGTVVTDGERLTVNTTGNPGMARGGSGDVLTGLITALLCQGMHPYEAAVLGAHTHGLAGDLARDRLGEVGMIATDLVDCLPAAFRSLASG